MVNHAFFEAEISPESALAGDSVEIVIRLVLHETFSAEGARLVVDIPATLGASKPTCFDQEKDGYVAVFCSNPWIEYKKRCYNVESLKFSDDPNKKREEGPYTLGAQRFFVIDFLRGKIREGDILEIRYGYVRDGMGCGAHITTNVLKNPAYAQFDIRYFREKESGLPDLGHSVKNFERPVSDQEQKLLMRILPREPAKLKMVHTQADSRLLILDRFSNLCEPVAIENLISGETGGAYNKSGAYIFDRRHPAIHSRGLPLLETVDFSGSHHGYHLYAGDLHTHSMWSNDCCEREKMQASPKEMFESARDVMGLDFVAITDHHQPWDEERNKIGETGWKDVADAVRSMNEPGRFLALAGFEFRDDRGDTPVIFDDPPSYDQIDDVKLVDVERLWDKLNKMPQDALCIPHLHNRGSLPQGSWIECPYPGMEPVMDVYSCHGSYERPGAIERGLPEVKRTRPDRFTQWFLQNGYHYGNTCNSDDHMGHPGSNALTMVYAKELTIPALFEALRARRCYGTSNARIKLWFSANGHPMGSILPLSRHKTFFVSVAGETRLKSVELIRNGELYCRIEPEADMFENKWEIEEDEKSVWYVRIVQIDNHIAFSSPIWFES